MPKVLPIRVDILTEAVPGDCPSCGFEAIRRVHGYHLTSKGVWQVFDRIFCGRCRAEDRAARE